jgi:hypothetical protein
MERTVVVVLAGLARARLHSRPEGFVVVGGIVLGDIRRSRQCIALRRPMPDGKQASRLMADVKSADQTVIQSEHMDGICVE